METGALGTLAARSHVQDEEHMCILGTQQDVKHANVGFHSQQDAIELHIYTIHNIIHFRPQTELRLLLEISSTAAAVLKSPCCTVDERPRSWNATPSRSAMTTLHRGP